MTLIIVGVLLSVCVFRSCVDVVLICVCVSCFLETIFVFHTCLMVWNLLFVCVALMCVCVISFGCLLVVPDICCVGVPHVS